MKIFSTALLILLTLACPAAAEKLPAPDLVVFFMDTSTSMDMKYKKTTRWQAAEKLVLKVARDITPRSIPTAVMGFSPFRVILEPGIHRPEEIERAMEKASKNFSASEDITRDLKKLDLAVDSAKTVSLILITDGLLPYSRQGAEYLSAMALRRGSRLRTGMASIAPGKDGIRNIKRLRSAIPGSAYGWADTLAGSERDLDRFVNLAVYGKSRFAAPGKPSKPPRRKVEAPKPGKQLPVHINTKNSLPVSDILVIRIDPRATNNEYLVPGLVYALTMMAADKNAVFEIRAFQGGPDKLSAQMDTQIMADGLKRWFVDKGISPDRISALGMGGKDPRFSNRTGGGRRLNSRVEIGVK